jgi:multidrug efflux pump subunit AcrA (membrane-fusion protein)
VTAQTGTIAEVRDLGGFIAPAANVSISSSLSEPAAEVDVVEGQHVLAGQTLAVLDVSDMLAEYEADVHAASEASAASATSRTPGRR